MGQYGKRELCYNDRSTVISCGNLAVYHVRPMELRQFRVLSRHPVPQNQVHVSLQYSGFSGLVRHTENVVFKLIPTIQRHGDLSFSENPEVKAA